MESATNLRQLRSTASWRSDSGAAGCYHAIILDINHPAGPLASAASS